MTRTLLFVAAGIILGLVIHLVVILTLPRIAPNSAYLAIASTNLNATTLIANPAPPFESGELRLVSALDEGAAFWIVIPDRVSELRPGRRGAQRA